MHETRPPLLILVDLTVLQIPGDEQTSRRMQAHSLAHTICSAINRLIVHFDPDVQFSYQTVHSSHPHLFHSQTAPSPHPASYNALDSFRKHLLRQVSAVINRPANNPRLAPISEAAESLLAATGDPSYDSFLDGTDFSDDCVPTLVVFANPSVNQAQFSTFVPALDEVSAASASRPKTLLSNPAQANLMWVDCSKSFDCLPAFRTWLSDQSAKLISLHSLTIDRRVIPANVAIHSAMRPSPEPSVCSADLVTVMPQGVEPRACGLLFRARISSLLVQPNLSAQTVLIIKHFVESPTDDSILAEDDSLVEPPLILSPFSGGASSLDDASKDHLWAENFVGLMVTLAQTRCQLLVEVNRINEGHCAPSHFALLNPMTPVSAILRNVSPKLIADQLSPVSDVSPFIEWQSAMLNGHVLALSGARSGVVRYPSLCTSLFEPLNQTDDPTEQKRLAAFNRDQRSVAEAVDLRHDSVSNSTFSFLQERIRLIKAARRPLRSTDEKLNAKSTLLQNLRSRLHEEDRKYLADAPQVSLPLSPQIDQPSCGSVQPIEGAVVHCDEAKVSQALDPVQTTHISLRPRIEVMETCADVGVSQVMESTSFSRIDNDVALPKIPTTPRIQDPLPVASVEDISVTIPPVRPAVKNYRFEVSVQKLKRCVNVIPQSPIVIQDSDSRIASLHSDDDIRQDSVTWKENMWIDNAPEGNSAVPVASHREEDNNGVLDCSAVVPNDEVGVKPPSPCGNADKKAGSGECANCDSPLELLLEAATMKDRADHLLQLAQSRKMNTQHDAGEDIPTNHQDDKIHNEHGDDSRDGFTSIGRVNEVKSADACVKSSITELKGSKRAYDAVQKCLSALAHLASILSSEGRLCSEVRGIVKSRTLEESLDTSVCKGLQASRTRMRVQSGWMVDNDLSVGQWGAIMEALEVVVWLSAAATFGLRKKKSHKRVKRLAARVQMIVSCVQVCGELSGASKGTTELYQECLNQLFGSILSPFTTGWKDKPAEWLLDLTQEYGSRNLLVTPDKRGKRSREKSSGVGTEEVENGIGSVDCDNGSRGSHKRVRYDSRNDTQENNAARSRYEDGASDGRRRKSTPGSSMKEIAEILKGRKEERKLVRRTQFASVENRMHGGGTLNRLAIKPEANKPKKRDKRKEKLEQKEKQERLDAFLRGLNASRFENDSENEMEKASCGTDPVNHSTSCGRFALDESALNLVERYDEGVDTLFEDLPPDTPDSG